MKQKRRDRKYGNREKQPIERKEGWQRQRTEEEEEMGEAEGKRLKTKFLAVVI